MNASKGGVELQEIRQQLLDLGAPDDLVKDWSKVMKYLSSFENKEKMRGYLESLRGKLTEAPAEVKEAYNKIIMHFDEVYFENFGWWLVDATDKNSGQTVFMVLPRPISEYAKCKIGDEWSRMIYNYRAVKGPFKSKEEADEAYEKMKGSHTPKKVEVTRGKG